MIRKENINKCCDNMQITQGRLHDGPYFIGCDSCHKYVLETSVPDAFSEWNKTEPLELESMEILSFKS
jgi:hypothetical protein